MKELEILSCNLVLSHEGIVHIQYSEYNKWKHFEKIGAKTRFSALTINWIFGNASKNLLTLKKYYFSNKKLCYTPGKTGSKSSVWHLAFWYLANNTPLLTSWKKWAHVVHSNFRETSPVLSFYTPIPLVQEKFEAKRGNSIQRKNAASNKFQTNFNSHLSTLVITSL